MFNEPDNSNKDNKYDEIYPCSSITFDDFISAENGWNNLEEGLNVQIRQYDGNDTVPEDEMYTIGLTEAEIYALDPDLVETAYIIDNSDDMNYGYSLNEANQTRRLLENANKAPLSITYKDVKILDGKEHATCANIDFNAGVYMTAIKPALLAVHEGWKSVVHGTSVSCSKISGRNDKDGKHLVCTQLTLMLTNLFENISDAKVVLHFYHTVDKIMIQGSTLISRVSSAVWMVEHFINPLAK